MKKAALKRFLLVVTVISIVLTSLAAPVSASGTKHISADVNGTVVSLKWDAVPGVSDATYKISYKRSSNSTYKTAATTQKRAVNISGLVENMSYDFKISNSNIDDPDEYKITVKTGTNSTAPTLTGKFTDGKIKLSWTKVKNATEYTIQYKYTGLSSFKTLKTTKSTAVTVSGLKAGKKYSFKIVPDKGSVSNTVSVDVPEDNDEELDLDIETGSDGTGEFNCPVLHGKRVRVT